MERKYSERSNGNPKSQSGRIQGHIQYEDRSTGDMSQQDKLDEGVSSLEPFERQMEDYLLPRTML